MYNKAGFVEKAVFVAAGSWPMPPAALERGLAFVFGFRKILGFWGMAPFGSTPTAAETVGVAAKAAETGQAAGNAASRRRYTGKAGRFFIGFNRDQS